MLTTPPPAPFVSLDTLPALADAFTEHIAGERRRAWTADTSALAVRAEGGRLELVCRGFPPAALEPAGLRALLTFFNDVTPRSHPTLSRLTPTTFAAVWRDLWAGDWPRPDALKVHERAAPGGVLAVWSVSAPSFGGGGTVDTVADLVAMLARELVMSPPLAALEYDPEGPAIKLALTPADGRVRLVVEVGEQPVDPGPVVTAYGPDGRALGDPLPHLRPRRRTGMETYAAAIADKYRAACAR